MNARSGVTLSRALAVALLAVSGSMIAPACADNESSLFIRGRKAPDEACLVECEEDGVYLPSGRIDAAFEDNFTATLIVGNQIVARGDSDVLRTETSRIQIYQADVRVFELDGSALAYPDNGPAVEYSVPISGLIDPGTSSDAGYGCASVPLLDGGALEALRARAADAGNVEVISVVSLRGRTLGGQEVESAEWSYPISVCFGCNCADVAPAACCAGGMNAACADLDEVEPWCRGTTDRAVDCRRLGTTCSEYLDSFGF